MIAFFKRSNLWKNKDISKINKFRAIRYVISYLLKFTGDFNNALILGIFYLKRTNLNTIS